MTDQMKVQAAVEVSTENAESALKRVGDAAGQMAERMQREGDKAGAAVDGIGSGASKSADEFSRAEGRIAASIKRATTNLELLGKTASQKLEFKIEERGLDKAKFDPLLSKLRELELRSQEAANAASASLGKVGVSAAQTAAALRGVPAQFTDIVVSLQSGQAPMTVLLQQGGQLKDMFGGVGNAAKALGGYVASLVTPLTVVAAGAAAVGYAFYSGRTESDEFRKNLILTGNASGITADKFNSMAAAMGNVSGITRGAAAEALTAMAASGNIGATSIQKLTEAALKFEKAGGPAVADTAKQFEELGKSPVDASVKLSEKTHYLTLAVYEQIKALQDQGKTSEAAAVAQNAWADAIANRTPQLVHNLGLIEYALDNIKRSAAGVWDWAKDIGRDATSAEKIAELQNKIVNANAGIADKTRYIERGRLKAIRDAAQAELDELINANKAKEAEAKRASDAQKKEDARISANAGIDKLIDSQRTKRQQYADDLKKLDAQRTGDLISEEKYQQAKAAIAKKYEDKSALRADASAAKKAAREAAAEQRKLDDLLAKGGGESATYAENIDRLVKALRSGKISTEQYSIAASQLWKTQTDAGKAWQASTDAAEAAAKSLRVWTAEHQSQLASLAEETGAIGQSAAARKLVVAGLQIEADARKRIEQLSLNLSDADRKSAIVSINAEKDKQKALIDTALRKQQAVEGAYQLEQENRRFAADSLLDERDRARAILEIESETWRERIQMAAEGSEERKRLEAAFQGWYANQAVKPTIDAARKALDTIDQTIHDSAVRLMEQGKPGWEAAGEALGNAFRAAAFDEIYKLTLKPIIVNIVGAFTSGAASAIGAEAAGQAVGGAGQAQQGLGMLSGLQTAFAGLPGGVSKAASSFATSGFGQAAGLSAAPVELAGPTMTGEALTGTALTGAGATFAAAAAPVLGALTAAYAIAEMQKSGWGTDNTLGTNVVLDRLFGHNRNVSNDARGIRGTFDLSGFSGENYQERSQKGGTFRSDRRWTDPSSIDADMDKALDSMLKQAVAGVQTIGKTLGIEAGNAIEGFSHTFALQLSENGDMSKAGEKIAAELKKVQDELVTKLVPNIADFARYGESAADTFDRLNQEVTATDAILLAMGKDASTAFGAVGLASIKAREDLIDLAGGIEKLANKTQFFYANFYSQSEQVQLAGKQAQKVLDAGFADLGLTLPTDTKGFRALVEKYGADLSTESSRKMFNSLLDLADEFKSVADAADDAASGSKKLAEAAKQASDAASGQIGSIFDTFATDGQKLDAAKRLVDDTFASINKSVPDSAEAFLSLAKSIDPATEAGQGLIAALSKVSNAFAYVKTSASSAAAAVAQAKSVQRSVVDNFDASGVVARAQADINAYFAKYGATAPTDQAGVAALASTLDANTEIGRQQLAELQALTGAFGTVFSARGQAATSQRSLQDSFDPTGAIARAQAEINAAFGKYYGATAPTTRAGVADVAGSINTGTDLGRQQMAELQALSSAFDTVFTAQERAAQAAADAAKTSADEQARAAQAAMDAAQRAAEEQMRAAQAAADEQMRLATQVHDSISGALKSLLGQSEVLETQSRQQAQATLQSALAIAKAGGSLANFAGLDSALKAVAKIDKSSFATALSYATEFGKSANVLTQLEKITRINGSHADGLDYVPFDGYVAQLHRGERVQTAASAAAADETASEIKALRADLNAIGAALATNTQKTAKLMEKFDVIGLAARV